MMQASQAPYVIAAYALTLIVILAYVASIRGRWRSVQRDLAAAREALDGEMDQDAAGSGSDRSESEASDANRAKDHSGPA